MYTKEKLLQMLSSNKASDRYEACERLRLSKESSPEIVTALDKATQDEDKDIVERAILALSSDVHYHMAVKMGMIEPDEANENHKQPYIPVTNVWKALAVLSVLSFITLVWSFVDLSSNPIGEGYDAMLIYCFLLPWLIGTVAFWILLSARWLAGGRKAALILSAVISIAPLVFYFVIYLYGLIWMLFS